MTKNDRIHGKKMIAYTVNHRVPPKKNRNDNLSISYSAVVLMELHTEFATVGGVVAFLFKQCFRLC